MAGFSFGLTEGSFLQINSQKHLRSVAKDLINNSELKQTDTAAANLQISIQKDSRPSKFSRPLTSITLNLNGDLIVDRRRVSLLKLPNKQKRTVCSKSIHFSALLWKRS